MKSPLRLAVVLCLALAVCFPAVAKPKKTPSPTPSPSPSPSSTAAPGLFPGQVQQDFDAPMSQVRIDVLMVAVPEDKFITLLPDLLNNEKIEKAVPELLEAVKRKEAILEAFPTLITKSGQRAVMESVKEVNYPLVAPAPTPDTSSNTPDQSGSAVSTPPPTPTPAPTPPKILSFPARNAGATLEVEPVIEADGKTIDLNIYAGHVQFLGYETPAAPGKTEGTLSEEPSPESAGSPRYYTMKTTTSVTLVSGQHMLIAIHKTIKPEGYMEVFILHSEIITAEK